MTRCNPRSCDKIQPRHEVRAHQAIEKENELQLHREKELIDKQAYRAIRKFEVAKQQEERKTRLRRAHAQKQSQSLQTKMQLSELEQARQAQVLAAQFEDELRLREFRKNKEADAQVRSDEWQRKTEAIRERTEMLEEEKRRDAEERVREYEEKLQLIEQKMAEQEAAREIEAEERNLKVVDAVERKARLERLEAVSFFAYRDTLSSPCSRRDNEIQMSSDIRILAFHRRSARRSGRKSRSIMRAFMA